jgi:hypothetical protein
MPFIVITDPLFYLAAIPGVILVGLAKGGFTSVGMISTPLLALYLPPLQAAAIYLPILLVQDAISVWTYRRDWSAWNLKVMLPGAAVGVCAAWALAAYVSDAMVRLAIGLIGLGFVLNMWFGHHPAEGTRPSIFSGLFWGAGAGFTSTLIQAGAPPFQVFVLPQRLEKMTFVGTSILFFAIVNVFKIIPYFALGQFTSTNLATALVLLPLAVAANFLGIWLVRITPTELFYRIAYVMVFFISLGLIWQGAADILRG